MNPSEATTPAFKANARAALDNANLQSALRGSRGNFVAKRAMAREALPEFDELRDRARDLKDHVLANLDLYLERYEAAVTASGGVVHWAETAENARAIVLDICRKAGAKAVNKGKTMISEECGINDMLSENGITPVETDLGEYIIQLRGEIPSHIIAPAVHVTVPEVEAAFRAAHTHLPAGRNLTELDALLKEARGVLRSKYFEAEVGITGANMLIAETGQSVIVTNEGNGDLSQSLPKVHIVMASLEKLVPTPEDAATILRVLARSATGQEMSVYTTFSKGPRRPGDPDGPEEYHVVLLDNGRSNMLGTEFQDMLRCIRCGACMNHCPVYKAVGGHAYGWVYPGPMGAVLTPSLIGVEEGGQLPNASSFCGRCEEVCPMRIPLPKMMRHWREREFEKHLSPASMRWGLGVWAFFVRRPALYRMATGNAASVLRSMAGRRGKLTTVPLAGGWTRFRDLPAPQGMTFQQMLREKRSQDHV
jgi:L-lactate dehydrogenase complex protein LldF